MATPNTSELKEAPKVLLHDHLDGGLRPATLIELAAQNDYDGLRTTDPAELATWMVRGASRLNLELYLETFAQTVGVMQTADALHRVAAECA
jgi:adenosine deaminase